MKLLTAFLLSGSLFLNNVETSDLTSEIETSEQEYQNSESVENSNVSESDTAEQTELQQLLEKWINGEIELDDVTLQKIYDKLELVTEEQVNTALEKYIDDAEERSKVSGIVTAIIGALLSLLAVAIYLKKIKNQGAVATLNNETFSKASLVIKQQVEQSKTDIEEIRKVVNSNQATNEKLNETILKTLGTLENQFKGIMGVLKITYEEGVKNEQGKGTQEK